MKINITFVRKVSIYSHFQYTHVVLTSIKGNIKRYHFIDVCEGWSVYNGICYKKFYSNTSWTDSVEFCENESAFLAEIPNIDINSLITRLLTKNEDEECYIGLYEDSTGVAWRIGDFSVTEPNNNSVVNYTDLRYGTIVRPGRWKLGNGDTNRCVVCMRGKCL